MAISNFKITKLPDNIVSKIGTQFIIIDQLYNIAEEANLNFQRIPELEGFYLNKKVNFKAYDDQLLKYSNEAEMNLIWKEQNLSIVPASANSNVTLVNGQTINFLEYLPINSATEFIEVYEITETLDPAVINDSDGVRTLIPGERFSPEDLFKSVFRVLSGGGGNPYYVFKYQVGKGSAKESTVYTFQINVNTTVVITLISQSVSATLVLVSDNGVETLCNSETSRIGISGGTPLGTVKLSFSLSNLLPTTANNSDRLIISINNQSITKKDSSATFNVQGQFTETGKLSFLTEYLKNSNSAVSNGSFLVTVLEIDGVPLGTPITLTVPSSL